jgi:TonB family protein
VEKSDQTIMPDGRVVYMKADPMPEYNGDLQSFLGANIRYPEEARKQEVEGRSVVKFIVSSDGQVSDVEIAQSSGNALLDQEALRVISLMQSWKPGLKDGHPVAVYFFLPVTYRLD